MLEVPLLELMKDNRGQDRTFKRYRVNFPVFVHENTEGAVAAGLAHNISLSGIGFVCLEYFEPGAMVEIEITLEAQAYLLLARICRCRRLDLPGDTMYHYGTQFERTEAVLRFIPAAAEFLLAHGDRRMSPGPGIMPSLTPATSPMG